MVMSNRRAQLRERSLDQRKYFRPGISYLHFAASHGAERKKRRDFVEILVEFELAARQRFDAVNRQMRSSNPFDTRTQSHEETTKLLNMRFAGGIRKSRRAL